MSTESTAIDSLVDVDGENTLIDAAGLGEIRRKVADGTRLSEADGTLLYETPALAAVGALANRVRLAKHAKQTYFNVNLHVNYTNICQYSCKFCAFAAKPFEERAYCMSPQDVEARLAEFRDSDVTEVHMVAGIHKDLPYEYYLDILRAAKRGKPDVHVKAFTMVEIHHLFKIAGKSEDRVLADLIEAGLGSCPGGGAEILTTRVWKALYREKTSPDEWLDTARKVQQYGLKMNATMLYGHIEKVPERVEHLLRLRALQDETGGFMTFIPLAFWPYNSALENYGNVTTGWNDLRQIAVSRLMLDNFPHIKAYWIMLTPASAQVALSFGADDIDGTVIEEKITHDAGTTAPQSLSREDLIHLIESAGYEAILRDTTYEVLQAV